MDNAGLGPGCEDNLRVDSGGDRMRDSLRILGESYIVLDLQH